MALPASLDAQCCKMPSRLTVGGYGEVAFSRNFFSDSPYIYAKPSNYKNAPGHGRFDIPHAVIYLGYNFGRGWTMQTEIEFEHTGTGAALEREYEEAGEFEQEIEKGGEVELEQFWLQKSFFPELNVRLGHIIVPVGGLNNAHEPLNFFTVYRPEGENTIFPSTWHDTGVSVWGQAGAWDPKETWALITILVYATALHGSSLKAFRKPAFFHWYCIFAFISVLITYFGVNLILGGMHSYA